MEVSLIDFGCIFGWPIYTSAEFKVVSNTTFSALAKNVSAASI
jgi:hypothetical protein